MNRKRMSTLGIIALGASLFLGGSVAVADEGASHPAAGVPVVGTLAEAGVDAALPSSVEEVHVPTQVGQLPELPTTIGVTFEDGPRRWIPVTWATVTSAQVATPGSFKVIGTAAGVSEQIAATVWVRASQSVTITGYEPVTVITPARRAPQLPGTVTGIFSDGSRDSSLLVHWNDLHRDDFATEGRDFSVAGDVIGSSPRATVFVIVEAPVHPVPEHSVSVTSMVVRESRVPSGGELRLTATITASNPFAGTVEILNGVRGIGLARVNSQPAGDVHVSIIPVYEPAGMPGSYLYGVAFVSDDPVTVSDSLASPVAVEVHFRDLAPGSDFYEEVLWLADSAITRVPYDFQPSRPLSRQAMAAFLLRAANPTWLPRSCGSSPYRDVPVKSEFCGDIAWLKTTNIATGYADGTFRPNGTLSRQAMSAFLYRLLNPGTPAEACTNAPFADIPVGSEFCGEIAWLKDTGITTGFAGNRFQPSDPVTRQAMAAFLYRAANLDN